MIAMGAASVGAAYLFLRRFLSAESALLCCLCLLCLPQFYKMQRLFQNYSYLPLFLICGLGSMGICFATNDKTRPRLWFLA
jgi:4-amino-4-deoxy-L-arabinose transferase-like glycosyltransferase